MYYNMNVNNVTLGRYNEKDLLEGSPGMTLSIKTKTRSPIVYYTYIYISVQWHCSSVLLLLNWKCQKLAAIICLYTLQYCMFSRGRFLNWFFKLITLVQVVELANYSLNIIDIIKIGKTSSPILISHIRWDEKESDTY
jgi:hypothetical protein